MPGQSITLHLAKFLEFDSQESPELSLILASANLGWTSAADQRSLKIFIPSTYFIYLMYNSSVHSNFILHLLNVLNTLKRQLFLSRSLKHVHVCTLCGIGHKPCELFKFSCLCPPDPDLPGSSLFADERKTKFVNTEKFGLAE